MDSKYIVGVITIAVTAMLVGSVLIPVIDTSSRGGTEYEDNPDWDGWIRFDLNRSAAAAYEISITQDENGIYVGAGTDVQAYDDSSTGEYATIFYADSNTVVWADDGDAYKVMGTSNGSPVYFTTSDDLTISRDSNGVSVSAGEDSYTFDTPSWAYVPKSTGTYGFYPYDADRGVSVSDAPTAVVGGGFAGVYAYNDLIKFGIDLSMVPIVEDGLYYGATWEQVTDTPDDVQITPLDPSVIGGGDSTQPIVNPIDPDPEPDVSIMSVPTPTYTDGDWGYDLNTVSGVQKAVIVSYSGAGGDIITVPATIGGYDVYRFGKGTNYNVFSTSTTAKGLVISDGIVELSNSCLLRCSGFSGDLIIPSSVKTIYKEAFYQSGFTGTAVIPSSVTTLGGGILANCANLKGVVMQSNAIPEYSIFSGTSGTLEVLDLSDYDYSVNRSGLADTALVSDSIGDSFGFIASCSVAHTTDNPITPYKSLLYAIPVIILIVGLLIMAGFVIAKRDY